MGGSVLNQMGFKLYVKKLSGFKPYGLAELCTRNCLDYLELDEVAWADVANRAFSGEL